MMASYPLPILLHHIVPDQNRYRWYRLRCQLRLDAGIDVICAWGRLGYRGGGQKVLCFADEAAACEGVERLLQRRFRRGYCVAR